jgi:hypothetical protein
MPNFAARGDVNVTAEDLLHSKVLPSLGLSQEDAERLLTILCEAHVYISVPLVLDFFSGASRLNALLNPEVQAVINRSSFLLSPAPWSPLSYYPAFLASPILTNSNLNP